jgi:hypothetical protein
MATSTVEQLLSTLSVSGDQNLKTNGFVERRDLLTNLNYYDEAKELENRAKAKEAEETEADDKPKPKV